MNISNTIRKNLLLWIILLSVIFRVFVAFYLGERVVDMPGTWDQISYHNLAVRVLDGHGFTFGEKNWPMTEANTPTAQWSFLYTLYLALIYKIFGVHPLMARLIQAVITGVLQPYLTYEIAKHLFNRPAALIGAGISAIYAYFIYYDASLMTEPFFITGILAGLYISFKIIEWAPKPRMSKRNPELLALFFLLGLVLGVTVLLRQLYMIFIPFQLLWIFLLRYKRQGIKALFLLIPTVAMIMLLILPFSYYNYTRFHQFVLLNTNSGFVFFWANNPIYGTHFQSLLPSWQAYQDLVPQELKSLNEAAMDQALMSRGIQFVLQDPIRFVILSFSRIPIFFMFWPARGSGLISNISRVTSFGLFMPFMVYGIIRSILDQKKKFIEFLFTGSFLLLIFAFIFSMVHLLSWAMIRYRLPVDAVLLVYAGYGIFDLSHRLIQLAGKTWQLPTLHKQPV